MRGLLALVLLAPAVAGCLGDDAPNADEERDGPTDLATWSWSSAAEPTVARGEAACATDGERLLLVGGFTGTLPVTPSAELYELSSGSWSDAPPLPTPLHHTAVAFAGERFWVLGGYGPGVAFTPLPAVWSWAPGEANWTPGPPLPTARGAHGAAVAGERVYVAGGVGPGGLVAGVHVLDIANGTWGEAGELSDPREHLAVDAVGDHVVVAVGRKGGFDTNTDTVEVLDTRTATWTVGRTAPTARGGTAGAGSPVGLLAVGGEGNDGTFPEVEAYDPIADAWTALPPDPDPRHGLCAAWMDDGLHVVTGGLEPGFAWSTVHNVLSP